MICLLFLCLTYQTPALPFERPAFPAEDLALLQTQLAGEKTDLRFWLQRINLYTEINELQSFAEVILLLADRFPQVPVFLEAKMFLLSHQGQDQEALALGQAIAASFPDYPSIRNNLGRIFMRANRSVEAMNVFLAKLAQEDLRRGEWQLLLSLVINRFESKEQLFKAFEGKLQQHPDNLGLQRALLALYTRFGEYGQATALLNRYPTLAEDPELARFQKDWSASTHPQEGHP